MRTTMKISTFLKKWQGKSIEDWGGSTSDDFNKVWSDLVKTVNTIAKDNDARIVNTIKGHYDGSMFVATNDDSHYVYISFSQEQLRGRVNVLDCGYIHGLLIRTAESATDYRGGYNNFCSLLELPDKMARLLKTEHRLV